MGHHKAAGHGIIRSPMVIEVRQAQGICHDVQLELIQMGQQILTENQGIRCGIVIFITQTGTFCPDKAGIKIGIVGNQHTAADEVQELGQHFLNLRRTPEHIIGNTRQVHDLLFQRALRVYKGLEAVHFLTLFQDHGTDFNDPVRPGREARGLQIKGHEFFIEAHILRSVDNNPVIHIVDIVAFATI